MKMAKRLSMTMNWPVLVAVSVSLSLLSAAENRTDLQGSNSLGGEYAKYQIIGNVSATTDFSAFNVKIRTNKESFSFPFTLDTAGGNWSLKCQFAKGWFLETGCDGTNIFSILYDRSPTNLFDIPISYTLDTNHAVAQITPGLYPKDQAWYVVLPWLTYACSGYFSDYPATNVTNVIAPWLNPRTDVAAHSVRATVQMSGGQPSLPKHIAYYYDAKLLDNENSDLTFYEDPNERAQALDNQTEAFRTNYPASSLAAEYSVLKYSNVNNGEFFVPEKAVLNVYPFGMANSTNKPFIVFEVTAQAIQSSLRTEFVPQIHGVLTVADWRHRNASNYFNYLRYPINNQKWLSDVELQALIENQDVHNPLIGSPVRAALLSQSHKIARIYVLGGFIIISAILFWVAVRTNRAKQSNV